MKIARSFLSLLLIAGPAVMRGDAIAVFDVGGDKIFSIAYRDDQHVRVNLDDNSYLLINGGKPYIAHRDGNNWNVQDLDALRRQFAAMGMGGMGGGDPEPLESLEEDPNVRIENTGRTERVAGIQGAVYEVNDGEGNRHEVVLTDHPGVVGVYRAFLNSMMSMAIMGNAPADNLMQPLSMGVPLRMGSEFALSSYAEMPLGSGYFDLPAAPAATPAMPAMGGQPPARDDAARGQDEAPRRGGMMDRLMDRSREEATEETERAVGDRVQRGIRGVFGR